jgi:hypothetical protein
MNKTVIAMSAALAAFAFGAAQAGDKQADKAGKAAAAAEANVDWEAKTADAFAKADADQDGFVTEAEAKAYWQGVSEAKVAAGEPATTEEEMAAHMEAFKKLSGEDGKATLEEVKAYQLAEMEKAKMEEAAKAAPKSE